jgi:hypothetical protein
LTDSNDRPDASSQAHPRACNAAVPVGALLIIAAFFLPWFHLGSAAPSGFDIAFRDESARRLMNHFGLETDQPTRITRRFVLVPLMAAGVLLINVTSQARPSSGSGAAVLVTRTFARVLSLGTGLFLAVLVGYVGVRFVHLRPAGAFWMTFSGGGLIAIGSVFDLLRGA